MDTLTWSLVKRSLEMRKSAVKKVKERSGSRRQSTGQSSVPVYSVTRDYANCTYSIPCALFHNSGTSYSSATYSARTIWTFNHLNQSQPTQQSQQSQMSDPSLLYKLLSLGKSLITSKGTPKKATQRSPERSTQTQMSTVVFPETQVPVRIVETAAADGSESPFKSLNVNNTGTPIKSQSQVSEDIGPSSPISTPIKPLYTFSLKYHKLKLNFRPLNLFWSSRIIPPGKRMYNNKQYYSDIIYCMYHLIYCYFFYFILILIQFNSLPMRYDEQHSWTLPSPRQ